jgi:hypothetical protein
MEFIEAPAFTRYFSSYLNDDEYRELQDRLGRSLEMSSPEQQDFGSFVGRTPGAAKEEEAVYG